MKLFGFITLIVTWLGLCFFIAPEQVVHHKAYTIYYNHDIKAADSVSWDLDPSMMGCDKVARVDHFAADPDIEDGPKPADFKNTTTDKDLQIDKGHLMSYESSMCDPITNVECFYCSQMYAQYHKFNAGDWKTVEQYEQAVAKHGKIHVIAGYIGVAGHLSAGEIIPEYMYKAIYHDDRWECWIMPNVSTSTGHPATGEGSWQVSTQELDQKTGLRL